MKTRTTHIETRAAYEALFVGLNRDQRDEALKWALDTRKYEIDLYWKRATYFWTFIAVIFAGFFALLGAKDIEAQFKQDALFLISCVGFLFSFAWNLANRGSKYWQENWEMHVALLEDSITGPLFKTTFELPHDPSGKKPQLVRYSVTRINQLLSVVILFTWIFLAIRMIASRFNIMAELFPGANIIIVFLATIILAIIIWQKGRSGNNDRTLGFSVKAFEDE